MATPMLKSLNSMEDSVDFSANEQKGFVANLKNPLPGKWKCPLCNLLMRNAIQTYRGEMACEACYFSAKGNTSVCPLDGDPIEDGEFFKDRHARREILQLEVLCTNRDNGCDWEGVVNAFEEHRNNCEFASVICAVCKEVLIRKNESHHMRELCPLREASCTYCGITLNIQSIGEHESTCSMKPLQCPYKCGENIQLNMIYTHVQICPNITQGKSCPYAVLGCSVVLRGASLAEHMNEYGSVHAALAIASLQCLQQNNEQLRNDLTVEQSKQAESERRFQEENEKRIEMEASLAITTQKYDAVSSDLSQLRDTMDNSVKEMRRNLDVVDGRLDGQNILDIGNKFTQIENQYVQAEEKLRNGAGSSAHSADEEVKQSIEKIDRLESGSAVLSANLSELELKLQLLENTCYEGQQLWKVDNVSYRINQAVTGKVTALHSAPCFQKRGGYKFCSRLYLNGDGMGRGTHVSLFFVIMKSEYDALLQWPFAERVTFRLINPHNLDDTTQESFIPDRNSSSFKRPTKDMNIAAGCPMFIKKELLPNYIVDDALYIETKITPTNANNR